MLTLQNLISTVQCTNVRFKDHRLVDTDDDTDADRMGPQFREATDLASSGSNLATAEGEMEDATNQTFSVANSTCDSTFVVGDSVVVADEPEVNLKAIEIVKGCVGLDLGCSTLLLGRYIAKVAALMLWEPPNLSQPNLLSDQI